MGQPLPPIANVLRIKLAGTINLQPWNVINFARFTGAPPTGTDCNNVASSVMTAWQNAFATLCTAQVVLRNCSVIDLTSDIAAQGGHAQNIAGTRAGPSNPNQVACVSSYVIQRRYRGGHPRSYWPLGNQSDVTNGTTWSTAFLPLAINGAVAWVGNINAIQMGGQPLQHGVVSYYERDPSRPGHSMLRAQPIFFSTQTVTVHSRVDTQRRRLGRELA